MLIVENIVLDDAAGQLLQSRASQTGQPANLVAAALLPSALMAGEEAEAALLMELAQGREELGDVTITKDEVLEAKRLGRK